MSERRRSQRITMDSDVYGKVKALLPARIVDLSREGAQLEVPAALRPLAECDLVLPGEGSPLHLRARVTRCRAIPHRATGDEERRITYRAGVQFTTMDADAEAFLDRVVGSTADGAGPIKIRIDSGAVRRLTDSEE